MISQRLGFSLAEIAGHLAPLPSHRAPSREDWSAISAGFGAEIDARIAALTELRRKLDGCIGCGCLSLDKCALYNPEDRAAAKGAGPRYLLGERPDDQPDDAG